MYLIILEITDSLQTILVVSKNQMCFSSLRFWLKGKLFQRR